MRVDSKEPPVLCFGFWNPGSFASTHKIRIRWSATASRILSVLHLVPWGAEMSRQRSDVSDFSVLVESRGTRVARRFKKRSHVGSDSPVARFPRDSILRHWRDALSKKCLTYRGLLCKFDQLAEYRCGFAESRRTQIPFRELLPLVHTLRLRLTIGFDNEC